MIEMKTLTIDGQTYEVVDEVARTNIANKVHVTTFNGRQGNVTPQSGDYTAEMVGARANTWLPTIAEIGAAPAGYGLGDTKGATFPVNESGRRDFNLAIKNGLYNIDPNKGFDNGPDYSGSSVNLGYGVLKVERNRAIVQTLYLHYGASVYVLRRKNLDVDDVDNWRPWEWANPPMQLGIEYRTTERHGGLPVYAKRIVFTPSTDFNANTTLTIPHGIDGYYAFTRLFAKCGNYPMPCYDQADNKFTAVKKLDDTYIYIDTNISWGKGSWTIDIFYPKD